MEKVKRVSSSDEATSIIPPCALATSLTMNRPRPNPCRLRRTAEEVGVVSLDRTPQGIAIKLGEKARVAPEALLALVKERPNATFTPTGVLRLALTEEETEQILETAQGMLLKIGRRD